MIGPDVVDSVHTMFPDVRLIYMMRDPIERIELVVDLSVDHQEYVEDCSVCCRPIVITVSASEQGANVQVRHEDE